MQGIYVYWTDYKTFNSAVNEFNELPNNVKIIDSLLLFTKRVKKMLAGNS